MINKLKDLILGIMIVGFVLLVKLPMIGAILIAIGLLLYPFFMLLEKKSPSTPKLQSDTTQRN